MIAISMLLLIGACGDGDDGAAPLATASIVTTTSTSESVPRSTTTTPPTTDASPAPEPFAALEVRFEVEMDATTDVMPGTFVASGPLVDEGLICATGTSFENAYEDLGGGHEGWETRFKCDDGSGSFSIWFDAVGGWTDGAGSTWASVGTWEWLTDKGTVSYTGMSGSGEDASECSAGASVCTESLAGLIERSG